MRSAGGKALSAHRPRSVSTVAQIRLDRGVASVRSRAVSEDAQARAVESLRGGTPEEAVIAVGRLLAVTEAGYERRAQLEQALQSRVAIEQAKGILAERYGLEVDEAFDVIRRAARSNRIKLQDLVRGIQPGQPTPGELAPHLPHV